MNNPMAKHCHHLVLQNELTELEAEMAGYLKELGYGA
ncbi:hypothetical protein VQ7734_02818 [Vibrio quintilis]|uniref:Uncharacterized protein n=1 Tax=Vibrio quintilis TaxID=1117707 RepID=A0A1M7YWJ2_9VIBR|nr:hypothetical protein VQ7734_02818 [Vibrio quintilis]